jgi:hypothetical protein
VESFPYKYLRLPLSVKKLSKNGFLRLIDKIADYLPGWKATLMHLAGLTTLIRAVLMAVPIHHFIAVQCPKWVLKAISKIIRAFLWKGRKDVKGGHCLVGWQWVCCPPNLGGLGILILEMWSWALQMRWLWLKKTQPEWPWMNMDIQVHSNVKALFSISVTSLVGDGRSTYFWMDWWLHGQNIEEIAPTLFASVPNLIASKRTVHEWRIIGGWAT